MVIAVSVLLFIATVVWFFIALGEKDWLAALLCVASGAAGVLQLALPCLGIHIFVGVMTFIEAVGCLVLLIWMIAETGRGGPGKGLGAILSFCAFLLFAWAVTFGILQFAIVV